MKAPVTLIAATIVLSSSGEPTRAADTRRQCPNPSRLRGICSMVLNQKRDRSLNSSYEYLYERTIYDAACADFDSDSDIAIRSKISLLFQVSKSQLICEGVNFDVVKGNIFKYAVNARTWGFLDKAIDEWNTDLNWIDSDQTTLLDYIERQITKNKETPIRSTLDNYYSKVRRAGGKHRRELP